MEVAICFCNCCELLCRCCECCDDISRREKIDDNTDNNDDNTDNNETNDETFPMIFVSLCIIAGLIFAICLS